MRSWAASAATWSGLNDNSVSKEICGFSLRFRCRSTWHELRIVLLFVQCRCWVCEGIFSPSPWFMLCSNTAERLIMLLLDLLQFAVSRWGQVNPVGASKQRSWCFKQQLGLEVGISLGFIASVCLFFFVHLKHPHTVYPLHFLSIDGVIYLICANVMVPIPQHGFLLITGRFLKASCLTCNPTWWPVLMLDKGSISWISDTVQEWCLGI